MHIARMSSELARPTLTRMPRKAHSVPKALTGRAPTLMGPIHAHRHRQREPMRMHTHVHMHAHART